MVAKLVNRVRFITRSGIKDYNSNILKIRHKRHNNSNIEYPILWDSGVKC